MGVASAYDAVNRSQHAPEGLRSANLMRRLPLPSGLLT